MMFTFVSHEQLCVLWTTAHWIKFLFSSGEVNSDTVSYAVFTSSRVTAPPITSLHTKILDDDIKHMLKNYLDRKWHELQKHRSDGPWTSVLFYPSILCEKWNLNPPPRSIIKRSPVDINSSMYADFWKLGNIWKCMSLKNCRCYKYKRRGGLQYCIKIHKSK